MDEADLAQKREQDMIKAALSSRERSLQSPDGKCIWCKDEIIVVGTAFCSAECGDDYNKYQREMKQRLGRQYQ
ncbi:Conserved hypothetical protein [Candidatus Erwinia haradaeae]|uniref:Uncharacterized protein n=2 Tax=Candidatus Erwinia haradaeae TaxID=1922217 RepID=A0A451CZU8_9GAMM|nr:hypothetical protein [Candidatus Erwinia haradaeae]VFP78904.1 Conserved hypothetical protein [Candidatus Erwinia haradaeae]VFP82193.1 Conserved hypothetical protein [Candidatus Erwinia haradaeae]